MNNKKNLRKNFLQYWKMILVQSWSKSWEKWGMMGIILPAIVSLLFTFIVNWGKPIDVILGENWALYVFLFIFLYLATVGYFALKEPVFIYNGQQERIGKLKSIIESKKANIEIEEYNYPNRGQSKKVGISIHNKDRYVVSPRMKIVGKMKRAEFNGGEKISERNFYLPDDNRIFKDVGKLDFNDSKNIVFAEVDKNNVSLLLKTNFLLNPLFSDEALYNRIKWSFYFELYGEIKEEKFENGTFFAYIEAYDSNGETSLLSSGIRKISEPEESYSVNETYRLTAVSRDEKQEEEN